MLLKVKYYITCLLACVYFLNADHVCAQGREPDLWWSGIAPRTVFHHPLWGYVALFEFNGLYSGQSLSDMKPVLPEANWDRIKALPNMAILSSGVWVVAGGTPPRETPGSIFRFTPGKTPELLTGADLDSSIILGGGIDYGVICRSFEPDGFVLSRLYSTNSGASWHYGQWPDSVESGSWGFVNRLPDLGFVALYERDTSWHRLVRTSVSVAGETIYMSYTDGMSPSHVTYHVTSGKTKILSRLPPMQIANNMIIGYHSNSLRIYEPEEDLLRPILRARGAGDEPIFPSSFSSLVPHDGAIYTRNQNGWFCL